MMRELELARQQLSRVWTVLQNTIGTANESGARLRWEKALTSFRTQAGELNRRIKAWNLKVPAAGFQRKLIDVEQKISQVEREDEKDL